MKKKFKKKKNIKKNLNNKIEKIKIDYNNLNKKKKETIYS